MMPFKVLPPRLGTLAFALAVLLAPTAHALPYFVSIQPIQVCTDTGSACANPTREAFQTATSTIWAQAGIELRFDDWTVLNSTSFYHLQTGMEMYSLFLNPEARDPNPLTINVFFVEDINSNSYHFGEAFVGLNGIAIGSAALLAADRIDTIAHELGHNLGLTHSGYGAGDSTNLMTEGGGRAVPGSVDEIGPDGLGLDMLTGAQIATALSSIYVQANPDDVPPPPALPLPPPGAPTASEETSVPAPGALAPFLGAMLMWGAQAYRRRRIA